MKPSTKSHRLSWIVLFIGLLLGISGIVIATQKQSPPDRSGEVTQLLEVKNQLEEQLRQLKTEPASGTEKNPEELKKEQKRLAGYESLFQEKQKLELKRTELQNTLTATQKANDQLRGQWKEEKGKFETELTSLKEKLRVLEKEKNNLAKQAPKSPDLLDCTALHGADEKTVKATQKEWGNYLGIQVRETIDLGNGLSMEFVLIPPGKFLMGATKEEHEIYLNSAKKGENLPEWLDWESPQHEVTITKPFYMGKYEVMQQEYTTLTKLANPSRFQNGKNGAAKETIWYPVENISRGDSLTCIKLMLDKPMPKRVKTASLPTEAQWEYACRAGTRTTFHFGDSLNGLEANCNGEHPFGTTKKGESRKRTEMVGKYSPNAFGLFDMHGNVSEWCLDGFEEKAYTTHAKQDPFTKDETQSHVLRGGSWMNNPLNCRSASREKGNSSYHNVDLGFRVVLLLEDS